MITRYALLNDGDNAGTLEKHLRGEWVSWDDYCELHKECDARITRNYELCDELIDAKNQARCAEEKLQRIRELL